MAAMALSAVACDDTPERTPPDTADDADLDSVEVPSDTEPDDGGPTLLPELDLDEAVPPGRVVAGVATGPDTLIAGPKSEGKAGDFLIKNNKAAFVIEGARIGGGYRHFGGTVVDATRVDEGTLGEDRFGEIWFAWNLRAFAPESASVVSDGRDGVSHVQLRGRTQRYDWPESFIRQFLNPGPADLDVTYDYRMAPDEARLELSVTLHNDGANRVEMDFPLIALNMGDGVKSFAPGAGFAGAAGQGGLGWFGAVGLTASYAIELGGDMTATGLFSYNNVDLLSLPGFIVQPGETKRLEFVYLVSDEGTSGLELRRTPQDSVVSGTVAGLTERVRGRGDAEPEPAWVAATAADGQVVGVAPIRDDGTFELNVPSEQVTLQAWASGQGGSATMTVTPPVDDVALVVPAPGVLEVTVRDQDGALVPAQLTVFRLAGTTSPFAPSEVRLGPDPGSGRSALTYIIEAETPVKLPAGRYRAVASRGYSYELAEATFDLEADETRPLEMMVERVVDTTGWLAADMHLHGRWSSDSDVPYDARVRQAAANDLVLPMMTEHAYVGDLLSAANEAGVDGWVAPIPAQEVTTFEYGHFNAFPLVYDPGLPSGGGVYEHGRPGSELFEAMRLQQPEPVVIQVNHPRSGVPFFAYFDYVGLDSATGLAANPERFTTNWDLIEVFNGRCVGSPSNDEALNDWILLTNLGWRKTLSSGSDSHSEGSGIGHPRGWIALEKTALELDAQAIVDPLLKRRTFVSCGPFVRFSASDGTQMGELTQVDEAGEVSFAVEVWAPTWIGVTEVRLWENGVPVVVESFDDANRGPEVGTPAKRFDGVMRHTPSADAWYVVEVIGTGSLAPVELGDVPYALTNPIEVDVDRDGEWTPPGNPLPR